MESKKDIPKILLVDDRKENLIALKKILTPLKVKLFETTSGNEALALAAHHDFALILLDVQMPIINGYEVANILLGEEQTKHLPIIFLTAIDRSDDREIEGYGAGAVDYIFKPINPQILLGKTKVFVELYKKKLELNHEIEIRKRIELENKKLQENLLNNAYKAGIAENAVSVLHNIGNALTSISGRLANNSISKKLQDIKLVIIKFNEILLREAETETLLAYIRNNPQGELFLSLPQTVIDGITTQESQLSDDFLFVRNKLDSISEVVSRQQEYTEYGNHEKENINLRDIVNDLIGLKKDELKKHGIEIIERIESECPVCFEKYSLMQSISNIVTNSIESISERSKKDKSFKERKITITARNCETSPILEVIDNGIGIESDMSERLFQFGFTTKEEGMGAGLHCSANFLRANGGQIILQSEGLNKGAKAIITFQKNRSTKNIE